MRDPQGRCVNLAGAAMSHSIPVAAPESVVSLIDEGNELEEQGRTAEAMARYDAAAQADPKCARAHLNRGNVLLANARIDEARSAYQLAIACDPNYAAAHFNLGNLHSRFSEYERALHDYQVAIALKPDFANAHVAVGNAFASLGRTTEARESYERALAINPDYAEVHFNLGLLEMNGGHLEAAETSLRRALSTSRESDNVVHALTMVLLARDKSSEAVQLTVRCLERVPTWTIKTAFAACAARTRFKSSDSRIRAALTAAITEPWDLPFRLCWPAISLIMLDPRIAGCVRLANESWPLRTPNAALFGAEGLSALAADPLLRVMLQTVPVSTIEFERFLTAARHALLETATIEPPPRPSDISALQFFSALARQCFINEYVFDCDNRETDAVAACRTKLLALLDAKAAVPPFLLLAVAAYFPLYTLPEPRRLLAMSQQPGPVDDVLRQQVREPLEEHALSARVERLTPILHGVSEKVREQYEQNPYPRWVKLPVHGQALHFNEELRRILPLARFTPMPDDRHPEVLVAGCGTGSEPIQVAQSFRGARVLAVDLSLSSISYAMRKTREMGISSIDYAQADILQLDGIRRTFDVITASGVLHHMADPFSAWRTLLSRLRPGGFMHLGLYSQLARKHVIKAREFVTARGYGSTPDEIRRFRRELTEQGASVELRNLSSRLTQTPDFYSTSECRDWVFHVQEHRLTLDQIGSFLSESRLQLLGFELELPVLLQYHARFPDDPPGINLRNWARFEADKPETFVAMYQFWIQKPLEP